VDKLRRVAGLLDRLVALVMILILAVMLGVTSAGVFWRYALNSGLVWADELSRFLLVWASFLGATLAVSRGAHITIGVLYDRVSRNIQLWLTRIVDTLVILFMGAILVYGVKLLPVVHVRVAPTIGISMDIAYSIIPVSAGIIIFHLLLRILGGIDAPEEQP
jgi:TRAP-type C4-dicarboxylate transport system permease small subunit